MNEILQSLLNSYKDSQLSPNRYEIPILEVGIDQDFHNLGRLASA